MANLDRRLVAQNRRKDLQTVDLLPPHWGPTTGKELFSDSKVGFLTYGEKSNGCFALARVAGMGTELALTNDCIQAG